MFKYLLLYLIRSYQYLISPLMLCNCRFLPTCSAYTVDAIKKYGSLRGVWIGMQRLGRCHPWGGSGYDPGKLRPL